jgi:hypothetical protein
MINLFTAFAKGEELFYEGAFIAKVNYERFDTNRSNVKYKSEVIKANKKLCIIECRGYVSTQIIEKLTVYLIINAKVKEVQKVEVSDNKGILWRSFSKEEIMNFSHITGDTNSIHLTENPVVQGLYILKELCDTTQVNKIEVKYIHPVYGEEPVYILSFQATF